MREEISEAFFELISKTTGVTTIQRRVRLWTDFNPPDKPTIVISERADNYARDGEAPPAVLTINLDVIVYTSVAGNDPAPATTLNKILDAIDVALRPNELTGQQTLGGLVNHCWIEGRGFKETGDIDNDGCAVIPVKILLPT